MVMSQEITDCFGEPGAFAFFLCIALYLELIVKDNIRIPRILFLSGATISTNQIDNGEL